MNPRFATSLACYGLVVLAGGVSFLLPETLVVPAAPAQSSAPEVVLTGTVRDFLSTHPDFDIHAPLGFGHYTGNIRTTLDPVTKRPVFVGGGYKVLKPWRDADGRSIAPHLYDVLASTACGAGPGIAVNGLVEIANSSTVDSFDSRLGTYGDGNAAANAILSTNSTGADMVRNLSTSTINGSVRIGAGGHPDVVVETSPNSTLTGGIETLGAPVAMPAATAPNDLGPSVGDRYFGPGRADLHDDLHVDTLELGSGAVLVVHGSRRILCEDDCIVDGTGTPDHAEIRLAPGATLELFVRGNLELKRGRINMNTGEPARCTVTKLGPGTVRLTNHRSAAAARFVAPEGTMIVRQRSEAFGSFAGESFVLDNGSSFHVDESLGVGEMPGDMAGRAGPASDEAIASAATFDEWFRDVPGVNMSMPFEVDLERNRHGVYEYMNSGFYPIDGQLLGNEGTSRNDFFTYSLEAVFTYEACSGQFVEFQGGDGAWIFVNDQLAIDLGGITPFDTQRIDLDRLDLADGEMARLRVFYAHRNFFSAVFRLRTNLELYPPGLPSVAAILD